ncbi:hypothetical protein QFZ20_003009 [Flavobacterium sp. W4I14]|nr:hypothetical protein [Flavobacterium sp. W4I14]
MFNLKKSLKRLKKSNQLKRLEDCKTLYEVAFHTVRKNSIKNFCFAEIGVFKGDNALGLIKYLHHFFQIQINYIGFDLFDDIQYLKEHYPEDYQVYNLDEFPYWEFKSGGHTYKKVVEKLKQELNTKDFNLIKGDTTITLPEFISAGTSVINLVYIDGCHDYSVVKDDWKNSEQLFLKNPKLIVVFDDLSYTGVHAVKKEILLEDKYLTTNLNENQFLVYLKND